MLKIPVVVLAVVTSGLLGVSTSAARTAQARSAPDCAAVFRANQSMIETLAGQNRTADIQAIFVRAGCAAPSVGLPATTPPGGAKAALPRMKCRFKLLPPSLICTF